jgi:hypothetical protein
MAVDNTYNGWSNRETWLVNLWYDDSFGDYIRSDVEEGNYAEDVENLAEGFYDEADKKQYVGQMIGDVAKRYEDYVMEYIQEELDKLSGFLSDFIDLGLINWYELAREVVYDNFEIK